MDNNTEFKKLPKKQFIVLKPFAARNNPYKGKLITEGYRIDSLQIQECWSSKFTETDAIQEAENKLVPKILQPITEDEIVAKYKKISKIQI